MDAKNLTWEQIKELADMAMKAGNDFSLMIEADGDCTLKISSHKQGFISGYINDNNIWNPASSTVQGTYI